MFYDLNLILICFSIFNSVINYEVPSIWSVVKSPSDSKEIKPVNPKESQLWLLIGRTDAGFLCPWDSPGKNTGVGHHALLQGSSWPGDWNCIFYVSCICRQVPVFLPIKSHGQKCLVGCTPWSHTELGRTERLTHNTHLYHWHHLGSPKEGLGVPNPPAEKSAHTPGNSIAGNLPFSGAAATWVYAGSPEDLASPQWEYPLRF